jgi:hypothetical protein
MKGVAIVTAALMVRGRWLPREALQSLVSALR